MSYVDFPPFPVTGEKGPQVCTSIRFYLAIIDDLPFEQVRVISEHIQECEGCAAEFRLLQDATHLVASLPESIPSARVDQAILAALQSRGETPGALLQFQRENQRAATSRVSSKRMPVTRRWSGALALAAALVLLVLAGFFLRGLIFPTSSSQAFQLPAHLSWSGYVLHSTQTRVDTQGKSYQVEVYQDLGTNQMHIESTMQGQFDVVVVTHEQTMLGKDMMHHVAQWGAGVEDWAVDGSLFDLARLRQDLAAQRAVYLGQETFQGQEVYLVRASDGQVLLLNMRYLPVNVLRGFTGPGTGTPIYDTFALMSSAQVADSMWDMQVPPDFRMGELPAKS